MSPVRHRVTSLRWFRWAGVPSRMGVNDRPLGWSRETCFEAVPVDLSLPDDLWEGVQSGGGAASSASTGPRLDVANLAFEPDVAEPELLIATPTGPVVSISGVPSPADWEWDEAVVRGGRAMSRRRRPATGSR